MGRRILFVLGLVFAATGGWIVHHETSISDMCNAQVANPDHGFSVSPQCLTIVWPYSEGFLLLLGGAIFVFAARMLTRRVMAGEHQYMKDLKAGKFDHENEHLNAYNFNLSMPQVKVGARPGMREAPPDE